MGDGYDPRDAAGFIRLFGLSTRGAGVEGAGLEETALDAPLSAALPIRTRPREAGR